MKRWIAHQWRRIFSKKIPCGVVIVEKDLTIWPPETSLKNQAIVGTDPIRDPGKTMCDINQATLRKNIRSYRNWRWPFHVVTQVPPRPKKEDEDA